MSENITIFVRFQYMKLNEMKLKPVIIIDLIYSNKSIIQLYLL